MSTRIASHITEEECLSAGRMNAMSSLLLGQFQQTQYDGFGLVVRSFHCERHLFERSALCLSRRSVSCAVRFDAQQLFTTLD